uniref:Methyltransf_21 domain-containing protein n=1 Tax=Anisakis simplex TaxID=6269 RepID=A0A0M3J4P9_ANISI
LGIGHDVTSEWKLKNILPEHCQFYGADPSEEQNRRLYEGLRGKFFPIAVADKTHNRTSFLMNYNGSGRYQNETIRHIGIVEFIKHHAHIQSPIDLILIDIEGAEASATNILFDLLPFTARENEYDQNGIVFCQINVEFHWPNEEQRNALNLFILTNLVQKKFSFQDFFHSIGILSPKRILHMHQRIRYSRKRKNKDYVTVK